MHSSTIILATLAAAVSASNPLGLRFIQARQTASEVSDFTDAPTPTSNEDAACTSALDSYDDLFDSVPTPNAALESYVDASPTAIGNDPCSYTFPASLSSDWSSYSSEIYSWYSATAAEGVTSVLDACGASTTIAASDLGLCSTVVDDIVATGTGAADATTTKAASGLTTSTSVSTKTTVSGTSTGTSTATSTTTQTAGAAAREAGLVGAMLAGVVGAAMAL